MYIKGQALLKSTVMVLTINDIRSAAEGGVDPWRPSFLNRRVDVELESAKYCMQNLTELF